MSGAGWVPNRGCIPRFRSQGHSHTGDQVTICYARIWASRWSEDVKVNDHTMTILTGLVLTVTVGTLAQNSESIMASFTGGNMLAVQDDAFTVRAGKPQFLDVLLNDKLPQDMNVADLRVIDQPSCGTVDPVNGQLQFLNSQECSGKVKFTYCMSGEEDCKTASVAVNILRRVAPGPVVASADETEVARSSPAIAPTFIAEAAPTTGLTPPDMPEVAPQIAVAELQSTEDPRQNTTVAMADIVSMETVSAEPQFDGGPGIVPPAMEPLVVTSVPITTLAIPNSTDSSPLSTTSNGDSTAKDDLVVAALVAPPILSPQPTPTPIAVEAPVNVTLADVAVVTAPEVEIAAPDCAVAMTALPSVGGEIKVSITAPCLPNSPLLIRQGEFQFSANTDAAGIYEIAFPAFARNAEIRVSLPDGIEKTAAVVVPDAERFTRVALLWNGQLDLELHAAEYGARPGTPGYVWSGDPASLRQSRRTGGGYLQIFGSGESFAEIYTLPISKRAAKGTIDLSLHVADGATTCDTAVDLRVLRLQADGAASSADSTNVRFTLAPCADNMNGYEIVNALGDLRVAAR